MYIEPNTTIKFYSGIPLDNSYQHTLWFNSTGEQNEYFHGTSLSPIVCDRNSYQRVNRGRMRVAIKAEELYTCNYIAFRNTNFGVKWFYAFILGVEYVNNETSEVTYELDVMQTYMFDVNYRQCFIERQHSATDNVGENTMPEPVQLGDYIVDSTNVEDRIYESYTIIIASSIDIDASIESTEGSVPTDGANIMGIYSGIKYYDYLFPNQIDNANELLKKFVKNNATESIVAVFMVPSIWCRWAVEGQTTGKSVDDFSIYNFKSKYMNNGFKGYPSSSVRNKKLYTFPYNVCEVSDTLGINMVLLQPELVNSNDLNFDLDICITPNASGTFFPKEYRGLDYDRENGITISNFPQCCFSIDSFRAWLAQGGGLTSAMGIVQSLSSIGSGAYMMGRGSQDLQFLERNNGELSVNTSLGEGMRESGLNSVTGGLNGLVSNLTNLALASNLQPKTIGQSVSTPYIASQDYGLLAKRKHCKPQFLKAIDDFFTMYGYTQNVIGNPHVMTRERWTYTKTRNCKIIGRCPANVISLMESIYDNGITFWRNPSEVGNYSLSNNTL